MCGPSRWPAGPAPWCTLRPSRANTRESGQSQADLVLPISGMKYTGGSRTHAASCGLGTQFGSRRLCSCAGLHVSRRPLLQCVQLGHVGTHVGHVGHVRAETKLYKQRRDREIPKTLCVRYFTRLYVVSTRGVHARPLKRAARGSTGTAFKTKKSGIPYIGYYSIYPLSL